ncbi:MAG: indole-3-glycerol phosphate synthase TrpC [Candidatus Eisenbacteria bacterium]|uniref:Indole-3-glycerol phosphate synthase n=1 Tax=Eiseniibacteriota bacterium TaxID=2212470 RepID=A0A9D6L516_UNCEI|nr:indole-3-glycerol phosphate synthase TrpC [Candidatus Eisenbacteria bacterium]MBI3539967.1 indole-3-glycerol phosphate synthase TrpC [Candidatus Eisenbacteria bacterium]
MTQPATDFLARIADDRRRRIEAMRLAVPGHTLRAALAPTRPAGRLERALRRGSARAGGPALPLKLLCEFKRASPSRGVLNAGADPLAFARIYAAGGAAAMSLVTEPDHFHGDLAWVAPVRAAVALPLLVKDFVIDSYQLLDAAARGADGVLLLAALLSDVQMQRLITEARLLGLDTLVEIHDDDELPRALKAGATLIGINNRNLRTFEVDLATSLRLVPRVPPLVTAVAESGLSTPADLERLRETRCDAVLIGEALMTAADPAATLATLAAAARGASRS